MSPIEPPDAFHVAAALGWLELGNAAEAEAELAKLTPALLEHPDVLEVRWQICAAVRNWSTAVELAELLVRLAPQKESGWLHRAYALRRTNGGGIEKAWEALRPAYEQFPKVALIPYNLACYAAQLGQVDQAWEWYQKALKATEDRSNIQRMALGDQDLEPLWERIRNL